ncbi:MAG: hypothetical protein D6718_05600 [Acidobacteria bacterium]|nr:MAG: hypothetical protein D6718_05600 [Acidobacteriota bacterium]
MPDRHGGGERSVRRRFEACWLWPTLLGGTLRLAHLAFAAARDPLFLHPVVDSWYHADVAHRILEKGWLLAGDGAYYKGPLYSYLLAVLFALFGDRVGVVAARLLSVALGTVSVSLVAVLGRRLGGRRAAWAAGLTAAVYGTAIHFDTTMLLVPIVTVGLLAAADLLFDSAGSPRPERSLALAGLVLGLVSVTRANGLLAVAAASIWAAAAARRGRWAGLRPGRAAALVAVPAALVVLPVASRNTFVERDPVLISWNGGINLFMGNDPAFDQTSGNWHADLAWMRLFRAPRELGLTRGADHQRFFLEQTLRRAWSDPAGGLLLLGKKAAILLGSYEIPNNRRFSEAKARSPILAVTMGRWGRFALPFGIVGPLLAAGIVLAGRSPRRPRAPILVLALAWAATPVLFFNTARYRLPAVLLALPVAAVGLVRLPAERRTIAWWRWCAAAVAAAGMVGIGLATFPERPTLPPSDELNLAVVADREGRKEEALRWRRRAAEREPDNPMARIRLADTLRALGRCEEALPEYRAVLRIPGIAADWSNAAQRSIAVCLRDLGRYDEAAEAFARFIAAHPDRPTTGGRPDFHLAGVPPLLACKARIARGEVLLAAGRRAEAVAEFARVTRDCAAADRLASTARARLRGIAVTGAPPR